MHGACIDQAGDINASLKALPIFLLTSQCMVVFVGESYFRRMWCMLELFTFVRRYVCMACSSMHPLHVHARDASG